MDMRGLDHAAMQVVIVVMMVVIDGEALGVLAEQFDKGWVAADLLRVAGAADMAVEANHLIGGAHHQMQIVRDHQHAAAMALAQSRDQPIQLGLAGDRVVDGGFRADGLALLVLGSGHGRRPRSGRRG